MCWHDTGRFAVYTHFNCYDCVEMRDRNKHKKVELVPCIITYKI